MGGKEVTQIIIETAPPVLNLLSKLLSWIEILALAEGEGQHQKKLTVRRQHCDVLIRCFDRGSHQLNPSHSKNWTRIVYPALQDTFCRITVILSLERPAHPHTIPETLSTVMRTFSMPSKTIFRSSAGL
jgi:hypothetical protein